MLRVPTSAAENDLLVATVQPGTYTLVLHVGRSGSCDQSQPAPNLVTTWLSFVVVPASEISRFEERPHSRPGRFSPLTGRRTLCFPDVGFDPSDRHFTADLRRVQPRRGRRPTSHDRVPRPPARICTEHLPILIRDPGRLAQRLEGAETLTRRSTTIETTWEG